MQEANSELARQGYYEEVKTLMLEKDKFKMKVIGFLGTVFAFVFFANLHMQKLLKLKC